MSERRVDIINPEGGLDTIPESEYQSAITEGGFRPLNAAEKKESAKRDKYGTGTATEIKAGLEGAARGLTFGASDWALSRSGLVDQEALAERKARNPYAAGGGEAAGVVGGLLLPAGALVGAGVKGAATAGRLATEAAGLGLAKAGVEGTSLAARALAGGVKAATGSAVEGALYGAGQGVSEAALGDPADAAEKILGHATMGALLGGGLGGAFGALGGVGSKALEKFTRLRESAAPGIADAAMAAANEGTVGAAVGATAAAPAAEGAGFLRRTIAKAGQVASGADEGVLADLLDVSSARGAEMRKAAFSGEAAGDDAIRTLTKQIDTVEADAMPLLEQARGKLKDSFIEKIVRKDNVTEQAEAAAGAMDKLRAEIADMRADTANYGGAGLLNKLEKRIDAYEASQQRRVVEWSTGNTEGFSGKTFAELDDLKANLGQIVKPRKGASYTAQDYATIDRLQAAYKEALQPVLENQELWGEAGQLQSRMNQKWSKLLENHNLFRSEFMKGVGNKDWQELYKANPAAVETFLSNAGAARNDLRQELLRSHLDAMADFANEAKNAYALDGEMAKRVESIAANRQAASDAITKAVRDAGLRGEAKKIMGTRTGRIIAELARGEASLRSKLSGSEAAAAAMGPQAGARAMQLVHVERTAKVMGKRLQEAADGIVNVLSKAPKAVVPLSVEAADKLAYLPERKVEDGETTHALHDRITEITNLANNPELLQGRLEESMGGLPQFAPRLAAQMHFTAAQAVNHLANVVPKNPYADAPRSIRQAWRPSPTQTVKFERTIRAIHDPLGTIEDFRDGHVTKEAADALRAVYPTMYGQLVEKLVPAIVQAPKVPLQRRLQLSNMLGVQMDVFTSPKFAGAMQAVYAQASKQAAPAARPGVSKNYRAQQSETPLQRALQGGA